jgi:hypothetical protein
MNRSPLRLLLLTAAAAATLAACAGGTTSGTSPMSSSSGGSTGSGMTFFVSSTGSGNGADLGGLAGADQLCSRLATAAGAGGRTWRAYLSAQAAGGTAAVNARDRIGAGPWRNAKGIVVARTSPTCTARTTTSTSRRR